MSVAHQLRRKAAFAKRRLQLPASLRGVSPSLALSRLSKLPERVEYVRNDGRFISHKLSIREARKSKGFYKELNAPDKCHARFISEELRFHTPEKGRKQERASSVAKEQLAILNATLRPAAHVTLEGTVVLQVMRTRHSTRCVCPHLATKPA